MHTQIMNFLTEARREAGLIKLSDQTIVELGSHILPSQESPREIFAGALSYTGIDWRSGRGVDLVSLAHEAPVELADIVICCQMLEHDPFWIQTVQKACHLLRAGGWLFCTWAGPGYDPHELDTAPPWEGEEPYYLNLAVDEVASVILTASPKAQIHMRYERGTLDALLWARIPR